MGANNMSDILHVNHGYTLHETPPAEYNYAYQDIQSVITRNVGSPLRYILGAGWHGNFATFSGGLWQEGRDFTYDGLPYDSFRQENPEATFWSWTDNAYHTISVRRISQDPDNPRLRTFDIQDSFAGQLRAPFTIDIGYQFNWNFPQLGYNVDYSQLRGRNDARGYDYIANNVEVLLGYHTGTNLDIWHEESVHIFNGINASVYPYLIPQSEETHTITGGIVTS
jgi:hypothetical protein